MNERSKPHTRRRPGWTKLALAAGACSCCLGAMSAQDGAAQEPGAPATLEETRLTLSKWIETQQILSRERKDWQQGKEILLGRLELVKKEIATLEEKIAEARASVDKATQKRDALRGENEELLANGTRLSEKATQLETQIRKLHPSLPEPIQSKLQPLFQRIPEDPATTCASAAERFQNVLGILNELNKSSGDITVVYEVRELEGGKPSEVRTMYVGLAQAYYVSAKNEAGIGRPTDSGWSWETSKAIAPQVFMALEIQQGKQSPAFVPLPVKLQ